MLVITRKEGESLLIGGNIKINITKIKDMTILRSELVKAIEEENKLACNSDFSILKDIKK